MTLTDAKLTLVDSYDKLVEFHAWLGERKPCLAFDTETEGLHPWQHGVRLLQVGSVDAGWSFPWQGWSGAAMEAIHTYDGPLVAHNAKFDVGMLEHHDAKRRRFDWGHLDDTMLMAYVVEPNRSLALKKLGVRWIGPEAGAGQQLLGNAMHKQRWTWAEVPLEFPMYWAYAALDTVLTARMREVLLPEVAPFKAVYDVEMQAQKLISRMQLRGAPIDLGYTEEKRIELERYVQDATVWCQDNYGVKPSSTVQVAERLVADGCVLTEYTPTGKYKLDENVLLANQHHPLAQVVLKVRKKQKLVSTYLTHFLNDHDDGVLHCSINQVGAARTGRMSVSDPPLQTLPRGRVIRDCFVGSNGNKLVLADYDQIEMRLLAEFCRDEGLIEAILSGDLHTETARRVYGDPGLSKRDPRRQTAKNAGFAKIYGAGVAKFALTAGIPVEEARAFLASYDVMFPKVTQFQKRVINEGLERLHTEGMAYVTTPLGRRNICEDDGAYKLVNYLIQGTAADVLKQAMVRLDDAGLGDYMVLPIHDELLFDVPPDEVDDVVRIINEQMPTDEYVVPLTTGVDVVDRWGEKYAS